MQPAVRAGRQTSLSPGRGLSLDVDHVEARRRVADRKAEVAVTHRRLAAQRLFVLGVRHHLPLAHGYPAAVVVVELLGELGRGAHTRLPPVLWYLRMPSAAR